MRNFLLLTSFIMGLGLMVMSEKAQSNHCPKITTVEEASQVLNKKKYNNWVLVLDGGKTDRKAPIALPFNPSSNREYAVFMDQTEDGNHQCGYIIWEAEDLESVERIGKFHLQARSQTK